MHIRVETTYKAKILQIHAIGDVIKHFYVEKPSGFEYQPGQFITLISQSGLKRSYSIANWDEAHLELCISLKPDGKYTPELWQAQIGDFISFEGPFGNFVAPPILEKELCLICTGTGIAPFRAMIQYYLSAKNRPTSKVHLISGNRFLNEQIYSDEFAQLDYENDFFNYWPIQSREQINGAQGYVHVIYQKIFADGRDANFMICGWDAMCREARNNLKSMGYTRKQYSIEEYDG